MPVAIVNPLAGSIALAERDLFADGSKAQPARSNAEPSARVALIGDAAGGVRNEVVTDRLVLREWIEDDIDALSRIFASEGVWRYPLGRGLTIEETERFLARRLADQDAGIPAVWAVEDRNSGRLIGYLGLSAPEFLPEIMPTIEVGWRIDPAWWNRGLATEGGRAAIEHGFRVLGLDEIVSVIEPDNTASSRVAEKLGMRLDLATVHPTLGVQVLVYRIAP
jgi:RimJ/RimL family protein N-acetyltransferase